MEKLKPNDQRARNAIILIWIVLFLEVVNLISSCMQYDLLQTVANGGSISDEAAEANDAREQICGVVYLIAYLISAFTFILWFRRAYFNLHQKVGYLAHAESWAAGAWFVPIINLYRPYQIMRELYVETKELFIKNGLSEKIDYSTSYLGLWWALWLITGFIGNYILRFTLRNAETIDDYIVLTTGHIISGLLGIPLALITIKIIKDYAKAEPQLAQIGDEAPR